MTSATYMSRVACLVISALVDALVIEQVLQILPQKRCHLCRHGICLGAATRPAPGIVNLLLLDWGC